MTARSEQLSIIVPVFNEVRTVRQALERLVEISLPVEREILVVDDGSTDGTRDVLRQALDDGLPVEVIEATQQGGKGSAIRLGLMQARGTMIAIQDADLEADPQQLALLVAPILAGETAVVYGSRFLRPTASAPTATVIANRLLTGITNALFGSSLTDVETCYKVIRTDVVRTLRLTANRFDIEPQITARLLRRGHRIQEIPVPFAPRSPAHGRKTGWADGVQTLRVLTAERLRRR